MGLPPHNPTDACARMHAHYLCTQFDPHLPIHLRAGDRLCVEHERYIADDLVPPSHHSLSLSSFLRTCLSYLTSNAHAARRPSSLASLAFSWRASDRRHLWPKVCEESFCKTIFLPALSLSSSSSCSYPLLILPLPSHIRRRAFRIRSLSSAHGSIALSSRIEAFV